jgi:hypothetical protein
MDDVFRREAQPAVKSLGHQCACVIKSVHLRKVKSVPSPSIITAARLRAL